MPLHARTLAAVVLAALLAAGCGTARVADVAGAGRDDLVLLKGDPKMGPFGNAVVELLRVDDEELGATERSALIAPSRHAVTARCSVPIRDGLSVDRIAFTAERGHTYRLQLHLLNRPPGCTTWIVDAATDEVVAKPRRGNLYE